MHMLQAHEAQPKRSRLLDRIQACTTRSELAELDAVRLDFVVYNGRCLEIYGHSGFRGQEFHFANDGRKGLKYVETSA